VITEPPARPLSSISCVVPDLLARRARDTPERVAFYALDERDAWAPVSWRQYAERVARIAAALRNLGLGRRHHAAILAPTSIEWEFAQMACLMRGISVVGVDINYPAEQRNEALRSVAIDVLFVQDEASAGSIPAEIAARLAGLITFEAGSRRSASGTVSLDELMQDPARSAEAEGRGDAESDDDALVVFSSGTTGRPKPISYTHRQVLAAVASILDAYPDIVEGSHLLCWLPLANLFQRIVNLCAIQCGATSYVIGDSKVVMRYLRSANPHVLIGVPRFYEKVYAGICERIAKSPRPMSVLANRVLAAGANRARAARERRGPLSLKRRTTQIADRLVLRRLRRTFGSNLRYLVSGSAPMPLWLLDWFEGLGLPILEAYGVSENIIPVAMNRPDARRAGTVGKPLAGQEVRLADDNEILVRGPGVFRGYLSSQGEGPTGPGTNGFWATSDYGEFDSDGFLRVIGRKSEIFKLSTGRWIAPASIEALLRRLRYVEHAMVVGAGKRFVVAILAVDSARLSAGTAQRHLAGPAKRAVARDPGEVIRRDVLAVTALLPPHERPAGVLVTASRLTIEGGELTSNLKLRRSAIETNYAAAIDAIYTALEGRTQGSDRNRPGDEAWPLVRRA
jgi:long-chain acyl-CoA synthetase